MSVFTSLITKILDVPFDEGQSVTIRKLAPKHLEKAAKSSQMRAIEDMKAIGPSFMKEMQALGDGLDKAIKEIDPLAKYDRVLLILQGATSWTYQVERDLEHIEDLDDDMQDWLAREILRLAKPSLFVVKPENDEAAQAQELDAQKEDQAALPRA